MTNFYQDNPDILFHLSQMDLSQIVELKEDSFAEKGTFAEAPNDLDDAVDNYKRVLDIVGEIAGQFVAPRAPEVDAIGAKWNNGEVTYAPGTIESIDRLKKADLLGFTIPRKYGGLNLPKTVYSIAIELISRADASLMNIFGLQEIADTILKHGSEDQKDRFLPRFTSGEVLGSMALTEPDAGSDLQAVALKAQQNDDGKWHLNGVKRFITNGCAQISLVMARSEEGTTGGKGISLFIYERDKNMKIRRIEEKLGIHGSPTCELQFNNAPAELLGKRRMGLIKYTMSLMNGARLGVSAQAVGIAEAAFRAAKSYAHDRIQSKKRIEEFSAVYEMLTDMQTDIEAGRSLLYETSRLVDLKEGIEEKIEKDPDQQATYRNELKKYTKYASFFTPLTKSYATEMGNRVCYQSLQIHGGVGYTCDFDIERLYRDVRITNIYEGTTQLQVVAAISGVVTGVVFERLDEYENNNDFTAVADIFEQARGFRSQLEEAVSHIKNKGDAKYQEFHARRLVEMATDTILSYLLCLDALKVDRKKKVAQIFISKAFYRIQQKKEYILSDDLCIINYHEHI